MVADQCNTTGNDGLVDVIDSVCGEKQQAVKVFQYAQEHTDDGVRSDIVIVLCAGPAGLGKTLTSEVYSEIIRRPLYRVHSGQLGLNVAEMEKALIDTLTRAQRWGAVLLIDEADVYIKRRDDNIAANAVVGLFLRVLEYFNGLLFLTTNRVNGRRRSLRCCHRGV